MCMCYIAIFDEDLVEHGKIVTGEQKSHAARLAKTGGQLGERAGATIKVFDFFSGCGGTSCGFQIAGMEIALALDIDEDARDTFTANFPKVPFIIGDIGKLKVGDIAEHVGRHRGSPLLFCGCAPCQPFTKQKTTKPAVEKDRRRSLLYHFGRFVKHYRPEFIFVENVPGIRKVTQKGSPIIRFADDLKQMGYSVTYAVIASQDYGVPQRRRRLVLLASQLGEICMPPATHGPDNGTKYATVRDWIGDLPAIAAGELYSHDSIKNHRAAKLSELNLKRIKATPPEECRHHWPKELWLACHSGEHTGHSDVYGRMRWDEPATGLTTRCISLSNGRFGHPQQNRAISVREAACLQTFPRHFEFFGSLNSMARQIGNAVPVQLARVFGEHFVEHLFYHTKDKQ